RPTAEDAVEAAQEFGPAQEPGVIPGPPVAGEQPERGGESQPNVVGKLPQNVQHRGSKPPAGVAPYMAEKFAERPVWRDARNASGFRFSVMGWSFPAAPAEWQVQE